MAKFDSNRFTSAKTEWATPPDLFAQIDSVYHFTLDACALPENHKCEKYFTPDVNGLTQDWSGNVVWLNPPYGKEMVGWLKKALSETSKGVVTVALIPARTNTKWWREVCLKAREIKFICGRPAFGDATHGLPWPLALVIFGPVEHYPLLTSFDYKKGAWTALGASYKEIKKRIEE